MSTHAHGPGGTDHWNNREEERDPTHGMGARDLPPDSQYRKEALVRRGFLPGDAEQVESFTRQLLNKDD